MIYESQTDEQGEDIELVRDARGMLVNAATGEQVAGNLEEDEG